MVIVIPAYEPGETFVDFVKTLKKQLGLPIVIVNDGSQEDKTPLFDALKTTATVLTHEKNKGKGAAMKTAIAYVNKELPEEDGVLFADADGQHTVEDITKLLAAFKDHTEALVLGVRAFEGEIPWKSRFGNTLTRGVFSLVSGVKLSDTQTGLRAFGRKYFARALEISGERYEYEMNMLLCFARENVPFYEVPIKTVYIDQENSTSHFDPIKDSIKIYGVIFKFVGSSLFSALLDYGLFLVFLGWFGAMGTGIDPKVCANITARVISSVVNFLCNQHYVFESKQPTLQAALRYFILAVVILGLNTALLLLFTEHLGLGAPLAKPIVEVALFVVSFLTQNRFVFKQKKTKDN